MFLLLHVHYHSYVFFVEILNLDNKSKQSGLFCAALYKYVHIMRTST